MIDSHVHLVDFRQRLLPQEDLQQAMDESDVSHAVVFGLPVAGWPGRRQSSATGWRRCCAPS